MAAPDEELLAALRVQVAKLEALCVAHVAHAREAGYRDGYAKGFAAALETSERRAARRTAPPPAAEVTP